MALRTKFILETWMVKTCELFGEYQEKGKVFLFTKEFKYPLLNDKIFIRLGNVEYKVDKIVIEDNVQNIIFRKNIGFEKDYKDGCDVLKKNGWMEYNK